jgi:hypothetical protein
MRVEMGVEYGTHGEERNTFRFLLGKPEGRRPVRRPRRRWEDNMKVDVTGGGMGECELDLQVFVNKAVTLTVR